jgi:hypothetical protein
MDYIFDNLGDLVNKLEIIIIPSISDVNHLYPLPQPPFERNLFENTKFKKSNMMPYLVTNPGIFMLNDISFGIINTDVIKDICVNMVNKFTPKNEID